MRAEQPEVVLLKISHEVMTLAVASPVLSENVLRLAAEDLRDRVLELPSVSQVALKGTRDREITIELSEEELRRQDLSIAEVSTTVRRASLNLTMGEIRTDAGSVILHTVAKRSAGQDFEDNPLITQLDGTIVTLGDVAVIRDGFVDQDVVTEVNGSPAVLVRIAATEQQSVVEMADDIRNLLADYEPPKGVSVSIWNDNASPIFDRLLEIVKNGAIGTILVFICLVLVFELRIALWMIVGIPLSFVGSLLFFNAADLTLNLGTIFGFFLLVGIVVDDAVVVGESIAAEREKGKNALDAVISGARTMVGPLTIGSDTVRIVLFDENLSTTDNVQADLYLPAGTPFEETLAAAERFVEAAHSINDQLEGTSVDAVSMIVGNIETGRKFRERLNSSHLASVRLHLSERPERTVSPAQIERAWRRAVGPVSNLEKVEIRTRRVDVRPSVSYSLKHDDVETLRSAAAELRSSMTTVPGIYGISDDLALGKRHFKIELTPAGEAAGLTPALIGRQLRSNFYGAEVQRFYGAEVQRIQRGREEIKVAVRYPAERRRSLRELASERIHRPGGGEVPLSMVARIVEKREPAQLTRIDGKRATRASGRSDATVITPIQARREIREQIIPGLLAKYPGLAIEVEAGARDEGDMLETLGVLVPIVLLAIYALIAAFLRSYWKPLVAVVGVPIAFAGAIVSHWILG